MKELKIHRTETEWKRNQIHPFFDDGRSCVPPYSNDRHGSGKRIVATRQMIVKRRRMFIYNCTSYREPIEDEWDAQHRQEAISGVSSMRNRKLHCINIWRPFDSINVIWRTDLTNGKCNKRIFAKTCLGHGWPTWTDEMRITKMPQFPSFHINWKQDETENEIDVCSCETDAADGTFRTSRFYWTAK